MKNCKMKLLALCITSFFFTFHLSAQDFTYRPKNPAFGGSPLNYNWLQSSAQIQDTTEDPDKIERDLLNTRDPLENFTNSLNRTLLSRLSRQLLTNQFGEDELTEGSYVLGDYEIDVLPTDEGITITIFDAASGGETQIIVPHF